VTGKQYILTKEFEKFSDKEFEKIRADFQSIIDNDFSEQIIDDILFSE